MLSFRAASSFWCPVIVFQQYCFISQTAVHACFVLMHPHASSAGLPERQSDYSALEAQLRSSAASKKRLELASLPVDILRIVSQELHTWVRIRPLLHRTRIKNDA